MRMPAAGIMQQLEAVVVEIEEFAAEGSCVLSCEFSMCPFVGVVCPARIMQHCEQTDDGGRGMVDGGNFQAVRFYSPPVRWTVNC